jgi:hypothetical protein
MSTIIVELYDALKEAGASDEKARAAAQVLANYDSRFSKIEADLPVLKWMVGLILAAPAPYGPLPACLHATHVMALPLASGAPRRRAPATAPCLRPRQR